MTRINYLTVNNLTPSIFFCFSRLKCEKLANKVQQNLLSYDELSELNYILSLPNYRFLLSKKYQSRRECVMLPIEALIKATKN